MVVVGVVGIVGVVELLLIMLASSSAWAKIISNFRM